MKRERSYRRMTWNDRLKIEALWNAGHTYRFIAVQTHFAPSAIHREVHHGLYDHLGAETTKRPRHYSAQLGQDYADRQATAKGVSIKLGHRYDYATYVAQEIHAGNSPDVIVHALRRQGKWTVSTPTLYRYIDRGYIPGVTNADLWEKPTRKPTKQKVRPAARPPKGTSIERRPREISARATFGHWEMDSVIGKAKGKRQSLLVLTERLTRYEIILRVKDKTARSTVRALDSVFSKYPQGTFKTITVDNGSEFQDCYGMEHDRRGNKRTQIYYCHPYTSCERGSNERANRIIRRYFPKGTSFEKLTSKDCTRAMDAMNNMLRRVLGYATPAELFHAHLAALQLPVSQPN